MQKKRYAKPELTVHGDVEKITQGEGLGLVDLFVYGLSDPIGRPPKTGSR
ncbi:MAG: lasso peptide [Elainella sp. C42_A2020_010]|nr:lasso peptide [Elainella sp. C42_A2020_010]